MKDKNLYQEAMRYIENARVTLRLAGKEHKFYSDEKYVRTACGTAYNGMLRALDSLFDFSKVLKQRGRKSIEYYRTVLAKMDKKLLRHLNNGYEVLHLYGY